MLNLKSQLVFVWPKSKVSISKYKSQRTYYWMHWNWLELTRDYRWETGRNRTDRPRNGTLRLKMFGETLSVVSLPVKPLSYIIDRDFEPVITGRSRSSFLFVQVRLCHPNVNYSYRGCDYSSTIRQAFVSKPLFLLLNDPIMGENIYTWFSSFHIYAYHNRRKRRDFLHNSYSFEKFVTSFHCVSGFVY